MGMFPPSLRLALGSPPRLHRSCPRGHLGRRGEGSVGLSMPIMTVTQRSPPRAKACEDLLRYAVYNCMSIDTDKNTWDE